MSKEKIFSIISGVIVVLALIGAYLLYDFSDRYFLTALKASETAGAAVSGKGVSENKLDQAIIGIEKKVEFEQAIKLIQVFD